MKKTLTLTLESLETYKEGVSPAGKAWTLTTAKVKEYQKQVSYKTFLDLRPYLGKATSFVVEGEKRGDWTNYTIIGVAKVSSAKEDRDYDIKADIVGLEERIKALEDFTGINN